MSETQALLSSSVSNDTANGDRHQPISKYEMWWINGVKTKNVFFYHRSFTWLRNSGTRLIHGEHNKQDNGNERKKESFIGFFALVNVLSWDRDTIHVFLSFNSSFVLPIKQIILCYLLAYVSSWCTVSLWFCTFCFLVDSQAHLLHNRSVDSVIRRPSIHQPTLTSVAAPWA